MYVYVGVAVGIYVSEYECAVFKCLSRAAVLNLLRLKDHFIHFV